MLFFFVCLSSLTLLPFHPLVTPYLDLRFGGLFLCLTGFFPKAEQHPNADNLGDGGSTAGDTLPVFLWWRFAPPPPLERLLSIPPSVLIGLITPPAVWSSWPSCSSVSPLCSLACLLSSAMRRSSQTIPEEPCRRKEMLDLWRPAMDGGGNSSFSSSVFLCLRFLSLCFFFSLDVC